MNTVQPNTAKSYLHVCIAPEVYKLHTMCSTRTCSCNVLSDHSKIMQLILAYPTSPISAQRLASPCFLRVKLSCSVLTILLVSITLLHSIILSFGEVKAVTSPVVFVSVRACSDRGAPSFAQPGHPQWAKGLAVLPCLEKAERAEEFNQQSTVPRVNPWQANWVGQTALLPFTAHRRLQGQYQWILFTYGSTAIHADALQYAVHGMAPSMPHMVTDAFHADGPQLACMPCTGAPQHASFSPPRRNTPKPRSMHQATQLDNTSGLKSEPSSAGMESEGSQTSKGTSVPGPWLELPRMIALLPESDPLARLTLLSQLGHAHVPAVHNAVPAQQQQGGAAAGLNGAGHPPAAGENRTASASTTTGTPACLPCTRAVLCAAPAYTATHTQELYNAIEGAAAQALGRGQTVNATTSDGSRRHHPCRGAVAMLSSGMLLSVGLLRSMNETRFAACVQRVTAQQRSTGVHLHATNPMHIAATRKGLMSLGDPQGSKARSAHAKGSMHRQGKQGQGDGQASAAALDPGGLFSSCAWQQGIGITLPAQHAGRSSPAVLMGRMTHGSAGAPPLRQKSHGISHSQMRVFGTIQDGQSLRVASLASMRGQALGQQGQSSVRVPRVVGLAGAASMGMPSSPIDRLVYRLCDRACLWQLHNRVSHPLTGLPSNASSLQMGAAMLSHTAAHEAALGYLAMLNRTASWAQRQVSQRQGGISGRPGG